MDIGGCNGIAADKAMVDINADAVLISVMIDAILFDPASVQVLLLQAIWVLIPTIRQTPCFDLCDLLAGIALLGNGNKSCIDNLATPRLQTLRTQISLEHLEELLDHPRLSQSLSEEGDRGGVRNVVHHAKPDKLLKGAPVVDLKFRLFIAEIEQLLKNQHFEEDQRINPLSPSIALPLLRASLLKEWTE